MCTSLLHSYKAKGQGKLNFCVRQETKNNLYDSLQYLLPGNRLEWKLPYLLGMPVKLTREPVLSKPISFPVSTATPNYLAFAYKVQVH